MQKKVFPMQRKSLTHLGETEMEVLHHVWDLGEATVADVREREEIKALIDVLDEQDSETDDADDS